MPELVTCSDGKNRCAWAVSAPEYIDYHDSEWGFPVDDDVRLFEKLCLESFQSGLAWITVLMKRPAFRVAFHNFDPARVAAMTSADVERLLGDASIIRHRGKIVSAINNAGKTLALQEEAGSLAAFVWRFEPKAPDAMAPQSPESASLSKALKQRGFTWLGPTTVYAFMQAMGLVNDHLEGCVVRDKAAAARRGFTVPV